MHSKLRVWVAMMLGVWMAIGSFGVAQADQIDRLVENLHQVQYYQDFIYAHQSRSAQLSQDESGVIARAAAVSAARHGIALSVVIGVMQTESGFNPRARSSSGALGLMQVVPYWHRKMIAGRDLFSVDDAVEIGTSILAQYLKKAHGSTAGMLGYYCGYKGAGRWAYIHKVRTQAIYADASVRSSSRVAQVQQPVTEAVGAVIYSGSLHFKSGGVTLDANGGRALSNRDLEVQAIV